MACKAVCRLCKRLILSQSISAAAGALAITIPAGTYTDGDKYCIVLAQAIPTASTLATQAYIVLDGGTVRYPLVTACGNPVYASQLRTRTKYSTRLETSVTGAVFRLLGCVPEAGDTLTSITA